MEIPQKISQCPIIESLVELRFEPAFPGEAVFGLIYKEIGEEYGELSKLPILQIPEAVLSQDKKFYHAPHYKMSRDQFILQVGPRVMTLVYPGKYEGWPLFFDEIRKVYSMLLQSGVVRSVERLGLRYINMFEDKNIFHDLNLKMGTHKENYGDFKSSLTTTVPCGEVNLHLRVSNDAKVNIAGDVVGGSVVDIDAFMSSSVGVDESSVFEAIGKCHSEEKNLFFSLLKPEFLSSLDPVY